VGRIGVGWGKGVAGPSRLPGKAFAAWRASLVWAAGEGGQCLPSDQGHQEGVACRCACR
jgi:hypothetical protein